MYSIKLYTFTIITFFFSFSIVFNQDLTTHVNFEKFFNIEEELISLSDLIIQYEKVSHDQSDVHGLFNLTGTIEKIKNIHRDVTTTYRLKEYFAHPLNLYHLTKRLTKEWRGVVDLLLESAACVKAMRVKLQNIDDQLPAEKEFIDVTYKIIGIQIYLKMSPSDIMSGIIHGMQTEEPIELSDAFYFGKAAYEKEDYYRAIEWFEYAKDNMPKNTEDLQDFSRSKILSKLASAYFKNGWIKKAISAIDELLKYDPGNKMAKRNKEYFESIASSIKPKPDKRPLPATKFDRYYQQLCTGDISKNSSLASRLTCLYLPRHDMTRYELPDIKAEVFNRKPLIVRFPNLLNPSISKAIQFLGYEEMIWYMGKVVFREPRDRVQIRDKTYHKWDIQAHNIISNIKISDALVHKNAMFVQNIGLNGFHSSKIPKEKPYSNVALGTMVGFLSDASLGGDLVFPMSRTIIPVSMGDVVFYEEGARMAMCPVMYGSQWYVIEEIFERKKPGQSFLERRVPIL